MAQDHNTTILKLPLGRGHAPPPSLRVPNIISSPPEPARPEHEALDGRAQGSREAPRLQNSRRAPGPFCPRRFVRSVEFHNIDHGLDALHKHHGLAPGLPLQRRTAGLGDDDGGPGETEQKEFEAIADSLSIDREIAEDERAIERLLSADSAVEEEQAEFAALADGLGDGGE